MNFSAWAIRKPTPSILLFIMLTVAGLVAFHSLGIQTLPDMEFPAVTVAASLPGASPEQMEAEVARPIEDAIASIGDLRHMTTTVNDGVASMMVEFDYGKGAQEAVTDVRDAVTRIRSTLPSDLQEPVVQRVKVGGLPVITYAVSAADMDEADLSWFVDDVVAKSMLAVRGVATVSRLGGVTREVRVELDPVRLQALQVTAGEISRQLRAVQQEAPGGRGEIGGLEQTVRTLGRVQDAQALADISLPLADGRRIRLGDVAVVRDTIAERRQLAMLDGKRIVSFQVSRARDYDQVDTAERIRAGVAKLQAEHPRVTVEEIWNTADSSKAEYDAAMRALVEGTILAVLVVWLFLRDWRATFVSAVALPLSIIPTFLVMSMLGFKLNLLTLLAITLVIGILVDDAIVEIENIMRHLRMGKPPLQAAMEAADEIGLAVIATSLTLVAVFLPTAFVSGLTGELFRQFGYTASAAVLFSLLVARLLTPMMSAYTLKASPEVHHDGAIMTRYLACVRWCLDHPFISSGAAAAVFVGSMLMIAQLPTDFIGAQDTSTEVVMVEAPPGSTLEQTQALVEKVREGLKKVPDVQAVFATIGAGSQTGFAHADIAAAEVRNSQVTCRLVPLEHRRDSPDEIRGQMREALRGIVGARISIGREAPGEKMNIMLTGDDPVTLARSSKVVEADLRTLQDIGGVTSSLSLLRPEIEVRPDFARAAELGITSNAIGQAVRIATTGDYDFNLARLNLPGRQLYVRVMLDPASRQDPTLVGQLRVPGANGTAVPLANIAQIGIGGGPAQIDRYDRHRFVKLSVDLLGKPVGDVLETAKKLPSLQKLPPGVNLVLTGDLEYMVEMFIGFGIAMAAGIFCVYAVMVLLFHDFGQPATVLAALPLASCGALGLLWLSGFALSLAAMIGLLMLIGIVTKNSILLVDYAIMAKRDLGMDRTEAILDACHKRARPIVMTTVAMGAGMMPIAASMDEFRAPMAVVVIGGLVTSTVLSLLIVPVVFELVDELKLRLMRRKAPASGAGAATMAFSERPPEENPSAPL